MMNEQELSRGLTVIFRSSYVPRPILKSLLFRKNQ